MLKGEKKALFFSAAVFHQPTFSHHLCALPSYTSSRTKATQWQSLRNCGRSSEFSMWCVEALRFPLVKTGDRWKGEGQSGNNTHTLPVCQALNVDCTSFFQSFFFQVFVFPALILQWLSKGRRGAAVVRAARFDSDSRSLCVKFAHFPCDEMMTFPGCNPSFTLR